MEIQVFDAPARPGQDYIRRMFDGMARRYDLFTKLIGFGQDQRLRRKALGFLRPGMRVLDIGCGTGDMALESARRVGAAGEVVGLDLSSEMLTVARRRAQALGGSARLEFVNRPAEDLPLPGAAFDAVVSAYVLRNLYENIEGILRGVFASLKPGGRLSFLDVTEPVSPLKRRLFRFYFGVLVGIYGLALFGRKYPVPYLPESAGRFYKAHEFTEALARAGFEGVSAQPLMLGAITLYQARRP